MHSYLIISLHLHRWENINTSAQIPWRRRQKPPESHLKHIELELKYLSGHWHVIHPEFCWQRDKGFLFAEAICSFHVQMSQNLDQTPVALLPYPGLAAGGEGHGENKGEAAFHSLPAEVGKYFFLALSIRCRGTARFIQRARSNWENCLVQSSDLIVSKRGKWHVSRVWEK